MGHDDNSVDQKDQDPNTSAGHSKISHAEALPAPPPALTQELRSSLRAGFLIIVLFFFVGGGWAVTVPLSGASIALGVVGPESSRRTIQHLEGGIIKDIPIKDGDQDEAGQTLIVMEDVKARAEVGVLSSRLRSLAAEEARLWTERDRADDIDFAHPILLDRNDPSVREVINTQIKQWQTRRENDESRKAVLEQRISQLEKQIIGFERQVESKRQQQELIGEEIEGVRDLVNKGLERKPRLLALERGQAELVGDQGELEASIAQANEAIGETRLQIMNLRVERDEDIGAELVRVQAQRSQVEEQLRESRDRLLRTEIRAPVAGTVIALRFKTLGGVIPPSEPILDIVPFEDELIIEAQISPNDIDDVELGDSAYITFPSIPQRRMLRIEGNVRSLSADTLTDAATQARYYLARIEVDRDSFEAAAQGFELTPGMPAEVYIETEARTFFSYLVQPFLRSVERSFREN